MKTATQEKDGVLRLQGSLEIYDIQTLCRRLAEALAGREALTVDLGGVEGLDAAGAQAFWSARHTAERGGKALRFIAAPASVANTWKQLGMPADFFEPTST